MVARRGVTVDNNFIGGLITQATGLNFPENACLSENNCIFNERGFVFRRPSFDFESNYLLEPTARNNGAITSYVWKNASDDGTAVLVVMQVGDILKFYSSTNPQGLSVGILAGQVDLTTFKPSGGTDPGNVECQFASGFGKLFVTSPKLEPFYVSFDATSLAITAQQITINIRDFEGTEDTTSSVTDRPVSLSNPHNYNLLNQGWDAAKIATFHTAASAYPSNADVWWIFKDNTEVFNPATTLASNTRGNAQSSQAHFIMNAFNMDRNAISGLSGITATSSGLVRPSAVAFYAGRVFYSGVNAPGYTGKIYFSQIIQKTEFGNCFQAADPTSQNVFDLAPSDGGVLRIPGTGPIFRLINLGNYLLVFALNGVWMISGSQGVGFAANDFSAQFLSSVRCISATSFVDVQGYPAWWNIDGIYVVKPDAQGGLQVESITDQKIKDFFLKIPVVSKRNARGAYNPFTHVIQWIYKSSSSSTINEAYEFDKLLNFNILSGAFYNWTTDISKIKLHGLVVTDTGGSSVINIFNVADIATDTVLDIAGDTVITFGLGLGSTIHTTTKYLVSYNDGITDQFTWAECADFRGDFKDWFTKDSIGVDYTSEFITGYKVHSEGQRRFQAKYIYVFSENSDTTEYRFQSLWDFSNAPDSNRWSTSQTFINSDDFKDYIRKKIKVRGNGRAVQFKFSSVSGKPFNIIGWSTGEEAAANA